MHRVKHWLRHSFPDIANKKTPDGGWLHRALVEDDYGWTLRLDRVGEYQFAIFDGDLGDLNRGRRHLEAVELIIRRDRGRDASRDVGCGHLFDGRPIDGGVGTAD